MSLSVLVLVLSASLSDFSLELSESKKLHCFQVEKSLTSFRDDWKAHFPGGLGLLRPRLFPLFVAVFEKNFLLLVVTLVTGADPRPDDFLVQDFLDLGLETRLKLNRK